MPIRFGCASEKAFVPQHEVNTVETVLDMSFKGIVEKIVESRREACRAYGKCSLEASIDAASVGCCGQAGVEVQVVCDRLICRSPQLYSDVASEIVEISDIYADIVGDDPFESFEAEEALRKKFLQEEK